MRTRPDKKSKKAIRDSISDLVNAATRLSIAVQQEYSESDESDSTRNETETATSIINTVPNTRGDTGDSKSTSTRYPTTVPSAIPSAIKKPCQRDISKSKKLTQKSPGPYTLGDILIITNTYLGAKGTVGKVLSSEGAYTVMQDNTGRIHSRIHSNYNRVVPSVTSKFNNETN